MKIIKVPDLDTLLSYIELGKGITMLDTEIVKGNPNIKTIDVPNAKDTLGIVSVWKNTNHNPLVSMFLALVSAL